MSSSQPQSDTNPEKTRQEESGKEDPEEPGEVGQSSGGKSETSTPPQGQR